MEKQEDIKFFYMDRVLNKYPYIDEDEDGGYIFIHIPKTGGTSVRNILDIQSHLVTTNCGNIHHYIYEDLEYFIPKKRLDKYWKFCFIRNPVDKFISAIDYIIRHPPIINTQIPDKREFILKLKCPLKCAKFLKSHPEMLEDFKKIKFFSDQYKFMVNKYDMIEMNYIGTTKTINQDILNISKAIEVKVDEDMMQHKLNTSKGDFEHLKNNEELNEIINQLYNSDMKIFQYISKNKDIVGNNFKGMNYKGMLIDRPIY